MTKVENKEKDSPADFTIHDYLKTQGPGLDLIMIFFAQTELHLAPCNTLSQLWKTSLKKDSKALHYAAPERPQFLASDLISVEVFGAGESGAINGLWKLSIAGCCLRRISLKNMKKIRQII